MMVPSKETVIKRKYKGELKEGDVVFVVEKEEVEPQIAVVKTVFGWLNYKVYLETLDENKRRFFSEQRQSGYWGAHYQRGYLMHKKDLSLRDRIENFK